MNLKTPVSPWIWSKAWTFAYNENPHVVAFRKSVFLSAWPEMAKIKISADSRYKLYVNGSFVNAGPRKGDGKVWFYDELDLKSVLCPGENVIYVEVLRYPLVHRKGNHGIWRTEFPGLYMEGTILTEGQEIPLNTDMDFKSRILENITFVSESDSFAPLQILENAGSNPELKGCKKPGYDDSLWDDVIAYSDMVFPKAVSPGNLLRRPIPLLKNEKKVFKETICVRLGALKKASWDAMLLKKQSITIPPDSHEIVEISAGELTTGYLSLAVENGKNATIQILTSECYGYESKFEYKRAMNVPDKGDRTDSIGGQLFGFTDTYHVSGWGNLAEPEIYEPYWFRTFRYIRLDICTKDEPLSIGSLDYTETGYPLETITTVSTSDPSHGPIWDISLRTLRRCMHETYEDCPFYEQLQYAMDTRSQILYTYMVSGDDRLARQCIDDFHRSQRYDGLINCCYPSYGPNVIPGFSIYYILMIYDHMMFFGDKELVKRYIPTVEAILDYFRRNKDSRGLVAKIGGVNGKERYWSFIDWTPQWDPTTGVPGATLKGPVTMESMLYIYGLMHGAKLMSFLGREEDAQEYLLEAESVKRAVKTYCYGDNGLYQDGPGIDEYSQHCQVFAVLTEIEQGAQAQRIMLEVLRNDGDYAKCSVAMAFYLFRALEKTGLYEQTRKQWDPWRKMVQDNLTTCVEDYVTSRSDCHAWGALALYELPAVILGVRPETPGFDTIQVAPVRGYLTSAKGDVITPKGIVHVQWEWDGTQMSIQVSGPDGVKIHVCE